MAQSLFRAVKKIIKSGSSGTESVGNYDISFELYDQDDINNNVAAIARGEATGCTFGDSNQSKVVLVAGDTLTIPAGYTLKPANPKKSLVICCNTLINNGTISMTAKGPNVLPHDWLILGSADKYIEEAVDINIPAYANNRATSAANSPCNGNNGTNRNCGSGGSGACFYLNANFSTLTFITGSGSAFAGGAGTGGIWNGSATSAMITQTTAVDSTYPMRGSDGIGVKQNSSVNAFAYGGTGNTPGTGYNGSVALEVQNSGVGGRVIIYCNNFTNNGTIVSNGTAPKSQSARTGNSCSGGPSGAGAIDIFYYTLTTRGTLTANGGSAIPASSQSGYTGSVSATGTGGNGSITLLNWDIEQVVRTDYKKFTTDNWSYLFTEYVDALTNEAAL